jgi:hypothetical protein
MTTSPVSNVMNTECSSVIRYGQRCTHFLLIPTYRQVLGLSSETQFWSDYTALLGDGIAQSV